MGLLCACGSVTLTTAAVNTTFDVSCGFQPKAILFFWSGRSSVGQGEASQAWGMGFAVSTSSRRVYNHYAEHGVGTGNSAMSWRQDSCIATLVPTDAVGGRADLNALSADGFQLIIDDQFPADLIVGWIAYGGDDITDTVITDFTGGTATGNQDINVGVNLATGRDDKALILLGPVDGLLAANVTSTFAQWSMGVVAGDVPINACLSGDSADGLASPVTNGWCALGRCASRTGESGGAPTVTTRGSVTTWLSNGFRINWAEIEGVNGNPFSVLTLNGGRWEVGEFITRTDTNPQAVLTKYKVKGLFFGSAGRAESADDVSTNPHELIVGAAAGSNRASAGMLDKHASATTDIGIAFDDAAFYVNQSTAATIVIEGKADLGGLGDTGFTFQMTDADPSAAFVFFLAAGEKVGDVKPSKRRRRRSRDGLGPMSVSRWV